MADDYDCSSDTCDTSDTSSDVDTSTDTSDTSSDIDTSSDCSDTDCSDTSSDCDLSDDGSDDLPESDTDTSDSTDDLDTESADDTSDVSEGEDLTDDGSDELPEGDTETSDTSDEADTDSTDDSSDISDSEDLTDDGSDELPEGDTETSDTSDEADADSTDDSSDVSDSENLTDDGSDELPEGDTDTSDTSDEADADSTNDNTDVSEGDDLTNDGSDELPEGDSDTMDTTKDTNTNEFEKTSELSENESLNNDGSDDLPESADDTTETIEDTGTDDGVNMSESEDLSNDGSDELPDTNTETNTLNQFGDAETPQYDESKTDFQNAQDDLDFANSQRDEYHRAVEAGEIEPNEDTERQLQDSIDHAQSHLSDIENGQAYSYDRPSEYWASPEGREIAGDLYGSGMDMATKGVGKATGADLPLGDKSISEPSQNFGRMYGENYGYKDIGRATDFSKDLMENAHGTYDTEGDRYMQENFMRDGDGNPITAEQGRDLSFQDQEPTMHDNLHDPNLFDKNAPGDYTYESSDSGKKAYGSLEVSDEGVRDAQAQRNAGGEDRKADDDGGHLIGTRFNGAPDSRNLDAQNANLNRGSYNHREKSWQDSINNGDKVYVNVETPRSNGSERPDAYMGYSITEHPDGSREWDAFSYQNASKAEQEAWNRDLDAFDSQHPEDYDNPMQEVYDKQGYNNKNRSE